MRRLAAIAAALAVALAGVVGLAGQARSDGGPYTVRAIFDDASFAVTGEDVRVAGANVGSIAALGVTVQKRAAVTITIDDSRFAPFYANAHCAIRPQSLIGEEYVDCTPGSSSAAPLHRIAHGPGAGDYLLPVTRTSSPIDTDIVQDISTEPVRESLAVIINELGTGLAGRGSDLNQVIHRANPALGNTDKVLKILDRQDHTLAQLATSSDRVLAPLARERSQLAGFVTNADTTAVASARQAANISRTFREFPSFLRQLRPLLADLGTLSEQGTPVMNELGGSASALGRQFAELQPFARAARTSLINLGNAVHQAQPDLVASEPLARRLLTVGEQVRPGATSLATLLQSLNRTGGIEQLMTLLYRGVAAGNGFDSLGHYLRAEPITGPCTNYAVRPVGGCSANFTNGHAAAARRPESDVRQASPAVGGSRAGAATASIVSEAVSAASRGGAQSSMSGLLGYLMGGAR
jgi:phospholipid/cholesterol/gamma-HCH transport system substrate-binding protein